MSGEGVVYLLMILSVDACAGVILERSLRADGGQVGVGEGVLTMMGQVWTLMNIFCK